MDIHIKIQQNHKKQSIDDYWWNECFVKYEDDEHDEQSLIPKTWHWTFNFYDDPIKTQNRRHLMHTHMTWQGRHNSPLRTTRLPRHWFWFFGVHQDSGRKIIIHTTSRTQIEDYKYVQGWEPE